MGELSIGASFNLQVKYEPLPLAVRVVENVIRWNGLTPETIANGAAERILLLAQEGKIDRDFVKWCIYGDGPAQFAALDKRWITLMFDTIAPAIYAYNSRKTNLALSGSMRRWRVDNMTRFCGSHRKIDGFVANFDDPVWNFIYPPNGWLCGCVVLPVSEFDSQYGRLSKRKLPPDLLARCDNWLEERPDSKLRRL